MDEKKIHQVWMGVCLLANFLDGVLTLFAISKGVEEANPAMAWALAISPSFFIILKFVIFALAIEFIARFKPKLLSLVGVLFMSVVAWHVTFWLFLN